MSNSHLTPTFCSPVILDETHQSCKIGAPWGTEVNEPGGRLFGEAILKPGERRQLFDWEVPYLGTMAIAFVMLAVGLNYGPNTNPSKWAHEEAERRLASLDVLTDKPQSTSDE